MTRIVLVSLEGEHQEIDILPGQTLMEAAVKHDIYGIDGDCGGSGLCGTCLVETDAASAAQLPAPEAMERMMLAQAPQAGPNTRLACQIRPTPALEGIEFRVVSHKA